MSRHCWTIAAALAAAIVAAMGSPAARADGDPASDVLLVRSVFLPYESLSPAIGGDLQRAVSAVYLHGDRVKVAAIYERKIWARSRLCSGNPRSTRSSSESSFGLWYVGPLLVVMPNGFGVYDGGRPVAAAQQVLRSLSVAGGTPDDLVRSATTAVQRLSVAGALRSPDVRAPLVTAYPATAIRGKRARLHFDVFDDSGRARSLVRIYENGALVARRAPLRPSSRSGPVTRRFVGRCR